MARCENCNKFVGTELNDSPDVDTAELSSDDASIDLAATVTYGCPECGDEMKTGLVEVTHIFDERLVEQIQAHCGSKSVEAEIQSCEEHGTGKKNDPIRVVVTFAFRVTCDGCDTEIFEGTAEGSILKAELDEA